MEEFYAMSRRTQLLYIASELMENKNPVRRDVTMVPKDFFK